MAKANKNMPKDLTDAQKERWETEHDVEYIVTIYAGGEHRRAAFLAAEAGIDGSALDDLAKRAPGIREHMPPDLSQPLDKGAVQGNPVEDAAKKEDVPEETAQAFGVEQVAAREPFGGKGDHDGNGKPGGAKPASK